MLGKSNDPNDAQTSGVLIQYLREISVYLQEINISKKTTILAAAVLVLAGSWQFIVCRQKNQRLR